jgi:hypothetical protein
MQVLDSLRSATTLLAGGSGRRFHDQARHRLDCTVQKVEAKLSCGVRGTRLHCRYKGGKSRGCAALEELSHARGHAGVHGCGAEGIVANALAGLAKCALSDGAQGAKTNLEGIGAQGLKQFRIEGISVAGGEVCHPEHDTGVFVHGPEAAGALNLHPCFVGSGAEAFLPEEVLAQLASAPSGLQPGNERFPGLRVTARHGNSQVAEVSDYQSDCDDLENRKHHFFMPGLGQNKRTSPLHFQK